MMKQTKTTSKISESSGSVPEFIQKLFRMLENKAFKDTFCWNDKGTTFIVKDTNEFSRTILPKHFKHCNFASFVRQLNKYDFHKVRNGDDGQKVYGDQAWEFVHPKFMRDRRDLLEDIKRKAPGNKQKKEESPSNGSQDAIKQKDIPLDTDSIQEIRSIGANLQSQIDQLKKSRNAMEDKINRLKQTDNQIIVELSEFSKNMMAKDDIIKQFLKSVAEKDISGAPQAQHLLDSYSRIAESNKEQLDNLNKQLGTVPTKLGNETKYQTEAASTTAPMHKSILNLQQQEQQLPPQPPPINNTDAETASAAAAAASMNAGSLIGSPLKTADGLTFVTLGRLSSNMSVRDNQPAIEIMAADQTPTLGTTLQRPVGGLKRKAPSTASSSSTASPSSNNQVSWTVPPRILLVDDDSVYRDLSGKLLSVIGCTIDLAKDGVEALKKMGLEKYDLILMDIVMPKMDGISATRSIRQYDALTPIISMTSNFTDNDIMQYIGSGMTDILPKPFSKRTLYQMLEKYCAHLKAIQRVQGLDPSSSTSIPQTLGASLLTMASNTTNTIEEEPSTSSSSPSQQQQQQHQQTSTYSSMPSSSNSSTPSSTQSAFPLAPYPYPVTMNSVPTDISNGDFNNVTNNDIPNVTFWPQQQPQQQDPPPAIIPNDGKFTWAVPTSTMNEPAQQVFDPVAVVLNGPNKRSRMESSSQSQ
ncbi:response regulator [Mucor ambiguus]|uniref:Transcription factor n=1 Tax=Mucor ambiguus TaxID=91626 RepID=A0A0C9M5F1_9FUNG|nr:response regulator [Mucor ambiguus]